MYATYVRGSPRTWLKCSVNVDNNVTLGLMRTKDSKLYSSRVLNCFQAMKVSAVSWDSEDPDPGIGFLRLGLKEPHP